jgi:hypothetical protein
MVDDGKWVLSNSQPCFCSSAVYRVPLLLGLAAGVGQGRVHTNYASNIR